jgi:hypothetical protein
VSRKKPLILWCILPLGLKNRSGHPRVLERITYRISIGLFIPKKVQVEGNDLNCR